ncbi:MAG: hypothetical protein KF894_11305 [Labilithrix sp.]|nr:hypothetical protein [Labilithrix sp.]
MKRKPSSRWIAVGSASALGMLVAAFASCATNSDGDTTDPDPTVTVPEAGAAPDADAEIEASLPEAGCEPTDPGCTTEVVPCETVSLCLAPTGVESGDMLTGVWGSSTSDVWAIGSGGTILHYDGKAWARTPTGLYNTFRGIWGTGPNDVWAVASTGVIVHTGGFANGTATWENRPSPVPALLASTQLLVRSVWTSSSDDVRLGGVPFDIRTRGVTGQYWTRGDQWLRTPLADGGVTWRTVAGAPTVTSIWGSSASDVWMLGDNSAAVPHERALTFHGTPDEADAGGAVPVEHRDPLTWRAVDAQSEHTLEAVGGTSADDVWAVGQRGTIRRIGKDDDRWRKVDSPVTATLRAVWGSGPSDVWIVGDDATILHYDGTKLTPVSAQLPLGPRPNLRGVWGSGPNDVWIVGDRVALHYTGPKAGAGGKGAP